MFGDLGKMMKIAGQMKARMPQMQQEIANSRHESSAGGGVVTAVVNGKGDLVDLAIDPKALGDESMDAEMLCDLVKAAVAAAQQTARQAAAEAMKQLTGGVDIPGLNDMLSG